MVMSHMLADTTAELHAMADRIGVDRRYVQNAGTPREHYDICQSKRALALEHGALEIHRRQVVDLIRSRR